MHDARAVRLLQSIANLFAAFQRLLHRQRAFLQAGVQTLALHILHHQVVGPILATHIVQHADVGMI